MRPVSKNYVRWIVLLVLLGSSGRTFAQAPAGETRLFYNILNYGAHKDGSGSSTEAFRRAIAAAQEAGGGTVYVPAGDYITGPI